MTSLITLRTDTSMIRPAGISTSSSVSLESPDNPPIESDVAGPEEATNKTNTTTATTTTTTTAETVAVEAQATPKQVRRAAPPLTTPTIIETEIATTTTTNTATTPTPSSSIEANLPNSAPIEKPADNSSHGRHRRTLTMKTFISNLIAVHALVPKEDCFQFCTKTNPSQDSEEKISSNAMATMTRTISRVVDSDGIPFTIIEEEPVPIDDNDDVLFLNNTTLTDKNDEPSNQLASLDNMLKMEQFINLNALKRDYDAYKKKLKREAERKREDEGRARRGHARTKSRFIICDDVEGLAGNLDLAKPIFTDRIPVKTAERPVAAKGVPENSSSPDSKPKFARKPSRFTICNNVEGNEHTRSASADEGFVATDRSHDITVGDSFKTCPTTPSKASENLTSAPKDSGSTKILEKSPSTFLRATPYMMKQIKQSNYKNSSNFRPFRPNRGTPEKSKATKQIYVRNIDVDVNKFNSTNQGLGKGAGDWRIKRITEEDKQNSSALKLERFGKKWYVVMSVEEEIKHLQKKKIVSDHRSTFFPSKITFPNKQTSKKSHTASNLFLGF